MLHIELFNIFDYALILLVFLFMIIGVWRGFGIIGGIIGLGVGLLIAGLLVFFFSQQPQFKQKIWFRSSHLRPYIQKVSEWTTNR